MRISRTASLAAVVLGITLAACDDEIVDVDLPKPDAAADAAKDGAREGAATEGGDRTDAASTDDGDQADAASTDDGGDEGRTAEASADAGSD